MSDTTEPCKCLERIKGNLEKHHGTEVDLELKATVLIEPDAENYAMGAALPPLYYNFMVGKKRKRSHVMFKFCPFCGGKA